MVLPPLSDPRSRELFDLGLRDLESHFDPDVGLVRNAFLPERHMPHPSIWYAHCLLMRGGESEVALGEEIVSRALGLQELRDGDPHRGNFRWFHEDEVVTDLNACQFVVEAFVHLLLRAGDLLTGQAKARILESMKLALCEAERLDVHWTYTNIYLLDVLNSIVGGQILGDEHIRRRGERRLGEWARRTKEAGAPHEFNSPTYSAVQINALAAIAQFARDDETRNVALDMEQFVWRHVARYWHAPTMQLGGPHSRAYRRDVTGAPGFLKALLYKLLGDERLLAKTPYYSGPDSEGEVMVALTEYHCPPDAERMLLEPATRDVRGSVGPGTALVSLVALEFALGTMSRPYGVGAPPEPWPQQNSCVLYYARFADPKYGVLYCRYRVNAGPAGRSARGLGPAWLDIWDDGVFRTSQVGGRALVAYGLTPRGQRPMESLRLDIRMLGPLDGGEIRVGERSYAGGALEAECDETIVVADGEVCIGIVLPAPTSLGHGPPVVVWRDGAELVVSIVNYEGPAKAFWEYRSLAGPFCKGNVRNGFALWVAPRSEFTSLEVFQQALRSVPLVDESVGSVRRLEFGKGSYLVALEYDLMELRP